ncbi:hypothetical protein [Burkholderia sp. WSM2232]|uniref:hypothetical protein n=1 Tax=Burkholderia sp. WSM2232 TaxID=944436 RepID=UPI0012EC14E1|nr:hypothetical protein [Burkholderia sp. WSM2232]
MMRAFRFRVNETPVVLYTPDSAIPYYSKVEFPLADGDEVCLAIASEASFGTHIVYGLRHPADLRLFVAFAVGSLELKPEQQMYYLPRLPRFWGVARWRRVGRLGFGAALAVGVLGYLAHGEPPGKATGALVLFGSILAAGIGVALLPIVHETLRWQLKLPTRRQRQLLAVLRALDVASNAATEATICAI